MTPPGGRRDVNDRPHADATRSAAPAVGALRAARGTAFGFGAAWLASVAHVAAGGASPSVAGVLLVTALCAATGVHLSSRRSGPVRVLAVLAPVQLSAHLLLVIFGTRAATGHPGLAGHAQAGHQHGAGSGEAVATLSSVSSAAGAVQGLHMVAAHVVALLVTAVVLAYGERAVWSLVRWLGAVLVVPGSVPVTCGGSTRGARWYPADVAPRGRRVWTVHRRRGPPVAC